jgi:hypothetical protein
MASGVRWWIVPFHRSLRDVASWYIWGRILPDKRTDTLLSFLVAAWQQAGVPRYLQVDNEMSFTGGRWFSRLGRFIRLGLLLGSEVRFNPFPQAGVQRLRGTLSRPVQAVLLVAASVRVHCRRCALTIQAFYTRCGRIMKCPAILG